MPRLLILAAAALAGCAGTTHTVGPESFDDARLALSGRTVTVVLADGSQYRADALRLEADTTTWIDWSTGTLRAVPTVDIMEIQRRHRGRSALRTAGAGALVGAVVGFASGYSICADRRCTYGTAEIVTGFFGVTGAMGGAMWGAVGGAVANRPDRWELRPDGGG